jgi:membrane protease subunit HflK
MAWNDSNNNDRDPWGGRRNEQGPPDLDEIVRKMQQKLGGLFGGGRGGRQRPPTGETPAAVWFIAGAIILGLLVMEMFWRIEPAERGVVLRFGKHVTTLQPGPHLRFPRPIENVIRVNIDQFRAFTIDATMLTRDENIVVVQIAVQYRIKDVEDYLLRIADPDESVQRAAESAIRDIIGASTFDFVIGEGRADIAISAQKLMQDMLDNYNSGIAVTSVNMQSANPPEEVKASYDDAIKSREDEQRKINEAEAYRNEVVERAQGDASRIRLEAQAYKEQVVARAEGDARRFEQLLAEYQKAPDVMRERLYLETVETVLRDSTKIISDGGGGNITYLPLDKLMERQGAASGAAAAAGAVTGNENYVPPPAEYAREREAARLRGAR